MKVSKIMSMCNLTGIALASLLYLLCASSSAEAGLRAYWDMNEGANSTAADSSGFGNDGTLIADTDAGDPSVPLPGPTTEPAWITRPGGGGALLFSTGTDNYNHVSVSQSPSLQHLGTAFSFSLWIRQDSRDLTPGGGGGYPRLLSTPNYEIELGVAADENDYFWNYGGGPFTTAVGTTYIGSGGSLGEWYHMAITYDGNDLKKYINGSEVYSMNAPGVVLNDAWGGGFNGSALKLGSQTYPNKDWFIGALDDVAIWGNAYLEASAVAELASGNATPGTVDFVPIPEPASGILMAVFSTFLVTRSTRKWRCEIH